MGDPSHPPARISKLDGRPLPPQGYGMSGVPALENRLIAYFLGIEALKNRKFAEKVGNTAP